MPVSYKNRKGVTYYLCQGQTKTGKPRYYFAREPKEDSPAQVPEGYRISESVNGKVSLVIVRPQIIFSEELAIVEKAIRRHPKSEDYRVDIKKNQIVVYEREGPDMDSFVESFSKIGLFPADEVRRKVSKILIEDAHYRPILRFTLEGPKERTFKVERWSFLGGIDDWIDIGQFGKLDELANRLIPLLGTDDFFDSY